VSHHAVSTSYTTSTIVIQPALAAMLLKQPIATINHFDWASQVAESIHQPTETICQQQANILLSATLRYLVQQLPALKAFLKHEHQPALSALLAFKDTAGISDAMWSETVAVFGLGDYATIANIRQHRKQVNGLMPVKATPG